MVVELENDDQVTQVVNQFMEKKRKTTDLEVSREALKFKKQKQCKDDRSKKTEEKKVPQAAPTGYVHVRARRGQATDSHSLAERVRREKISERMGVLQSLVPGCDKIIGKALILDEIINYIQSLQNQVEFLVAKLASIYPMLNDSRTLASEDYGDVILDVDNQRQKLFNDYGFENLCSF